VKVCESNPPLFLGRGVYYQRLSYFAGPGNGEQEAAIEVLEFSISKVGPDDNGMKSVCAPDEQAHP